MKPGTIDTENVPQSIARHAVHRGHEVALSNSLGLASL
jgi:hypothetical protein